MTRQRVIKQYSVLEEDTPIGECFICLEEVYSTEIALMPCQHVFHKECLREWLRSAHNQVGRVCPVCSKPISKRTCMPCVTLNQKRSSGCVIL